MSDPAPEVTMVLTVTLPNGSQTTLRNIASEAALYVDAQVRLAGYTPTVYCLVGDGTRTTREAPRV